MSRRLIGQIHLWTALVLCVPLVVLGLTGSVLVFEDELRDAFAAAVPAAAGMAHPATDIIAAARAAAPPGFAATTYLASTTAGRLATVRFAPGGRNAPGPETVRVDVDPVSLAVYPHPQDDFLRQLFFLHSTLLLKNRDGRQLVGGLGVAMLVMGISGLVNWWPRRGQWRAAFTVGKGARGFRLNRELHGATGIWALAVFLVVSFGGVELAFPDTVRGVVALVLPARDLRAAAAAVRVEPINGAEPIGIDEALALARRGVPDARPTLVFLPTRPDQPFRIAMLRIGQERRAPAATIIVDPWKRRVIEILDPQQFTAGEAMLAWQHAIHAGQGLGWIWKVLVFLSGLLPLLFTVTGVAMWWRKRRVGTRSPVADAAFD